MSMAQISDEEFDKLLTTFDHELAHLETRDAYGTAVELPHMAKWAAGEPDDLEWLQGWCTVLREAVSAGKSVRRARIVSEPLSDYQRWSFYLVDNRLVVFLTYSGSGLDAGKFISSDPADIQLCRSSFDAVWKLSLPHRDYHPL